MTDSGYINRAFRPEPGRKYWNHLAKHTRGEWHRHWLLTSGQYIKTSDPDSGRKYGWKIVGEDGPELVKLLRKPPGYTPKGSMYPPPHHLGSAADVEHHWPGCGHE